MPQTLLERFFDHLRQRPGIVLDAEHQRVIWPPLENGDRAGARIEFVIPQEELRFALDRDEAGAAEFWPDVSSEIAGFRLMYTHMMENAESERSRGVRCFRLRDGEFVKDS